MKNQSNTATVGLDEICPTAIEATNLREISSEEDYNLLKKGIDEDGQQDPIMLRKLTPEEQEKAGTKSKYGILDGHHRYDIAKKNQQQTILAQIDDTERTPEEEKIFAARKNFSRVNMQTWEKGKVIVQLAKAKDMKVEDVGAKIFGLKRRMVFICTKAYQEHENGTDRKQPVPTPTYDIQSLRDAWNKLGLRDSSSPTSNAELYNAVRELAEVAKVYAAYLYRQPGVRREIAAMKKSSKNDAKE